MFKRLVLNKDCLLYRSKDHFHWTGLLYPCTPLVPKVGGYCPPHPPVAPPMSRWSYLYCCFFTPHLQNIYYINISIPVIAQLDFHIITVYRNNLKKHISPNHQGNYSDQTLMSVYYTTMVQCNLSISTIFIYIFNINVPSTHFVSQYVRLTLQVNSILHRNSSIHFNSQQCACIYNM